MGIGDWGLGIGPNPQSPIPNPQLIFIIYYNNYELRIYTKLKYYSLLNTFICINKLYNFYIIKIKIKK